MTTSEKSIKESIETVNRYIYGNWVSSVTSTFAELGVADILHEQHSNIDQLSQTLKLDAGFFKRFLRCASDLSLVNLDTETGLYSLDEVGNLLRSDHPHSKREEARLNGAYYRYEPWGKLPEILEKGSSKGLSPTVENGSLDFLKDKPEKLKTFHQAMTSISISQNNDIIKQYDFSRFSTVLDVGCGEGTFLTTILDNFPQTKGCMFDLPDTLDESTVANYPGRLTQTGGDFFDKVPDCADLYTMKNVVHNWPEEKVIKLLKNTAKAMKSTNGIDTPLSDKRLLIIENLIPEKDEYSIANWMDLNFMILVDGADRTLSEYKRIGKIAGLKLENSIPTASGRHILEFSLI